MFGGFGTPVGGAPASGGGGSGSDKKFQLLAVRCLTASVTYNMQQDIDAIAAGTFTDTTYTDSGLKAAGEVTHVKRQLVGGGGGGYRNTTSSLYQSLPGAVIEDKNFVGINDLSSINSIPVIIGSGGLNENDGGNTTMMGLVAFGGPASSLSTAFGLQHLVRSHRSLGADDLLRSSVSSSNNNPSTLGISSIDGPAGGAGLQGGLGGHSYISDSSLQRLGGVSGAEDGQNANSYRGFGAGGASRNDSFPPGAGGVPGGGGGGTRSNTPSTMRAGGRGEIRIEFWGVA